MDTDYLTPQEVAQRLRVDDYTVRGWIHAGILEAETITQGRRTRYQIKKAVIEVIERRGRHQQLV
jgi:excisionase family DNA binding protein